jgi:hypothetical protein
MLQKDFILGMGTLHLKGNISVNQLFYLTEGDGSMAKKIQKIYIRLGITVLILATVACGTFQVGVETPAPGRDTEIISVNQEPESELTALEEVQNQNEIESTPKPAEKIPAMAYLGPDGNVWVLEAGSETLRQVTFDANPVGGDSAAVEYGSLSLSSDGTLLAYRLDVGTPSASGYDFIHRLWVVNLTTGEQHQIMDGRPAGLAWKPGTHLLAYGTAVDMNYFISRPDPALATGIRATDLDSGETLELVAPERGYALSGPKWSSDGRFLAFTEVFNMEGSGLFAYYDLEGQEYVAWDEPVGRVSWSLDGNLLTYARHTYAATGEERLYIRPPQGSEQLVGPDYDGPAYATHPIFSPAGNQIAYLAFLEGPETQIATILVLDLVGGEPKSLGQFEGVWEMAWVPDGSQVVFSFGHWESRQIIALNLADGSQTVLAAGSQLALAGQ